MTTWLTVSAACTAFAYLVSSLVNWDWKMGNHTDDSKLGFTLFSCFCFVVSGMFISMPHVMGAA